MKLNNSISSNRGIFRCAMLVCALMLVGYGSSISSLSYAAEIKKWVDENGKTHYGEQAPAAVAVDRVDVTVNVVEAAAVDSVVLYSTSWCGYCKQARRYLAANGIAYREYDIERNLVAKRQHQLAGGRGVPLLVRGDQTISGFSQSNYDRFFAQ
ncbi:glutaredoxin family protein [Arenicella xantha]|uniref:Glutaredoxin n=1 Tax=Arenicella xantha TaxID=644221 RepID=A0A395JGV3_9GAMM|nr:glutaredoxin family protein [Arenicella xantha]RBP49146.1 glutaredoxin [Arenicella xantha]